MAVTNNGRAVGAGRRSEDCIQWKNRDCPPAHPRMAGRLLKKREPKAPADALRKAVLKWSRGLPKDLSDPTQPHVPSLPIAEAVRKV